MSEKLKQLLDKIGFDKNNYKFFDGGSLDRIIGNHNGDYSIYLNLKEVLPLNIYRDLDLLIREEYANKCNSICLMIFSNKVDDMILLDYIKFFVHKYSSDLNNVEKFFENIQVLDKKVNILLKNKTDVMRIRSIENTLLEDLSKVGIRNVQLIPFTDEKIENKSEVLYDLNNEESFLEASPVSNNNLVSKQKNHIIAKPKDNIVSSQDKDVLKGKKIYENAISISDILYEEENIVVEAEIFGLDIRTTPKCHIITLKITDGSDSIYCKIFENNADNNEAFKILSKNLKEGNWYKIKGNVREDSWMKELVLFATDIMTVEHVKEEIKDNSIEKRVELHAHTFMSQMDGLIEPKKLVAFAKKIGHKAIAVTDHNCVQAFPDLYHAVCDINKKLSQGEEPFKVIYGTELTLINDGIDIVKRENDSNLMDNSYVVFDFETTGFNAGGEDSIIEVGAVLLKNGEIVDEFSELIDPGVAISPRITNVTGITTEMVKGKDNEETVIKRFIEWFKDYPMVAHNAKFDVSFLEMAYSKYKLGTFNNTVIDTLELSRTLDSNFGRHSLTDLVKRYNVPWDEGDHHRATYDARGTALAFHGMMKKLTLQNKTKISDLNKLVSKEEMHKYGKTYHVNVLAKNKAGLKNLFKIISLANTTYLTKTGARIIRSELEKYRDGLLIGSGCVNGEVFLEARSKTDEELTNIINFYDYVEVQPLECYSHLLLSGDFSSMDELREHVKKIINTSKQAGKIVVATGDVHHLTREDKIYREIVVNQKVPGGGRHPLAKYGIKNIPYQHFRTTDEMMNDFSFLSDSLAKEIVIENTNKICDMVEEIEVIIDTGGVPFSPKIENSVETVKKLVYDKAHELYGENLPEIISNRIEQELKGIINGGFDVIYLIAQKLVKKSNDDGYLVGSRGSVGSSFVATLMGITEVNPLPAHYVCPNCKHSIFETNGESLGSKYSSGYDLPDMNCPICQAKMLKEGQDMPFATFLGFNADKVPDIDLNFSGEYQAKAHEYTKVLFGEDYVYRAGTIGTVADRTAFGFVKGYCEDQGVAMRTAEVERLAQGCTGVKRTTGQHPGGIVVIPNYMDVFDFTPFQYPADDLTATWRTTHFDYHAIDEDVLKLDILGHDDPTMLKMLQDVSGLDVTKIPLDDKKTMEIFCSPEPLGVTKEQILCETGTLGVPEFGTRFVISMLMDTKPKTFAELVKISGLSHGTDVWLGNAQELIKNNIVEFKDVIGCRDDIMVYLMYKGMEPIKAFKIMEFVRKGKPSKDFEKWKEFEQQMKDANIEDWFIDSCQKIKYMFPKAHAAAYVLSAFRIAWFKVHQPINYYMAYFSIRCNDFDIESMIKGYNDIKLKIAEISSKGKDATNKDTAIYDVLSIALEASARGIKFTNIDINKSDAVNFIKLDDHTLIPPFRTIDGLGGVVAQNIVEERKKHPFLSIDDLQTRAKISSTLIERMRFLGILDGMDESNQLSLF